jgi:RimJ/RimL family protein N-acetyltransferase
MLLEGLLVNLVPYGDDYRQSEHRWRNGEAWFWATMGDRWLLSQDMIKRRQQEQDEWNANHTNHGVWFGIETKAGKPIGDIAINWVVPQSRLAMLGAAISETEYWGGGYGTDALLLIIDYAFEWLDFRKIWLATMSINARVMRQMEKVGFTLEARQRHMAFVDGVWADALIYGMFRADWPGRPAMIEKLGLTAPL